MRNELIETITNITDTHLISKMLMNMSNKDLFTLMSLLDYADNSTQKRWISTYNDLIKF